MRNLQQFESLAAYNAAKDAGTLGNPCVSLIKDGMSIGFDPYVPPILNDEIWYTSSNGNIVTPYQLSSLPTIVSNTYNDGKGVIKFASDVTIIGDKAFYECYDLISVTIPNSVTSIGYYAFQSCTGLTSVTTGNSVTSIADQAFCNCMSLISIKIPDKVTYIGRSAFFNCLGLTSVNYTGTIAQWNSITKGSNWNYLVPATVVHCSDGDVAI